MENQSLIKWHAQELCKLLLQDPNNPLTNPVAKDLEAYILNSLPFKNIKAKAPEATK